jgi:hypothetical protein
MGKGKILLFAMNAAPMQHVVWTQCNKSSQREQVEPGIDGLFLALDGSV